MNKSIAELLKEYRLSKGLSQKALAEELAVDARTVAKWEAAKALPSAEHLIKILEICCASHSHPAQPCL